MISSISIKNISKRYKIYPSRLARLKDWINPFGKKTYREKWVLKGIDLEIAPGEAVGIIGMNGAGKSTLLKIITGTTIPTTGTVQFNGKVAALLELGLGFHPEFTGRQNIYMSGQLLGYSNEEITECMEQVETFAEIGEAIDAPVRTYSSGMQVRLAFSVATMKRPDILIVDEALSVGDVYFQHKSFSRIKEFIKAGTTLLLVSHDKATIQAVCNRAVLLDQGSILKVGNPEGIMDYYNAMIVADKKNNILQKSLPNGRQQTTFGNGYGEFLSVNLLNGLGEQIQLVDVGEWVQLVIEAEIKVAIADLVCGIQIRNRLGEVVYGVNTGEMEKILYDLQAGEKIKAKFSFPVNIGVGYYSFTVALHSELGHVQNSYIWTDLALLFEVVNKSKHSFVGSTYLDSRVEIFRH